MVGVNFHEEKIEERIKKAIRRFKIFLSDPNDIENIRELTADGII